ncbi:MAG: hypothetical protein HGA95_00370 [Caldiserica bacterium]|nr:hypothetical protein [Caldisericota bacterium]
MKLKLFLLITLLAISVPIVTGKPYQNTLKDPIFGYINFMPDVMIDSMLGGKYAPIKHPYLYLNSGKSVKCYEPTSGKLVHTVPFDSSKESPWSATDEGVTFLSSQKTDRYCRFGRFDGTELVIPIDDKVYYVSWGTKPLLVYQEYDNASRFYTFEAKDLDGKTVWKIERIKYFYRWYDIHFWMEINGTTSLIDMQTGKAIVDIPKGYYFVSSMGQFATLRNSKTMEYATFSIDENRIIHESSNINYVYGDDEVLYCSQATQQDTLDCYELLRVNINGDIIEKKLVTIPLKTDTVRLRVASFYKNLIAFDVKGAKQKLVIFDTLTEKNITQIEDVQYSKFFEDKFFYVGSTIAGCFDTLSLQNVWTTAIGNNNKPDVYQEKDFGKYKLVGRQIQSNHKDSPYALQVRIINKIDGSVEPVEFFFEYGNLKNLYETDYGFVNVNTSLKTEDTNYPQISFYRRGSANPVGSIDNIGLITPIGISVRDGRYLTTNYFGKELEIDCRLMTYSIE